MDETVTIGVRAYQERDYTTAVTYLEKASPKDWMAQLYLAMSLYFVGRGEEAERLFGRIKQDCLEKNVRDKAETAYVALKAQAREDKRRKEEKERLESTVEFDMDKYQI